MPTAAFKKPKLYKTSINVSPLSTSLNTSDTKPKKKCPACGKSFKNLNAHMKTCKAQVNIGD